MRRQTVRYPVRCLGCGVFSALGVALLGGCEAELDELNEASVAASDAGGLRAMIQTSSDLREDPLVAWDVMSHPTGIGSEAAYQRSMHYVRFAGGLVSDALDVLETEETTWHAPLRSTPRTARTRQQLAELIDSSVLEEALAGL